MKDNKVKKCKCSVCSKKLQSLMIQMYTCRCNGIYCREHLHLHDCRYDYTQASKVEESVTAAKVDKI